MFNFISPLLVEQENGKPVCFSHQKKNTKHIHMIVERAAKYILFDTFWISSFGFNIINHKM